MFESFFQLSHVNHTIYLASRSPRRIELLKQLGLNCKVLPTDIDESVILHELPADYVQRLAKQKAEKCFQMLAEQNLTTFDRHILGKDDFAEHQYLVIAADTSVAIHNEILGKPKDDNDARAMLKLLSDSWHEVHTAIAMGTAEKLQVMLSSTNVEMMPLSDAQIEAYIKGGEHKDKAGSYGIQGQAGAWIKRIEGSYTGVMGLPIHETALLLRQYGVNVI